MHSALLLAAFAVTASTQDRDVEQDMPAYHIEIEIPDIDIRIPKIDIQIPAIDLVEFDVHIADFHDVLDDFYMLDLEIDIPGFDFYIHGFDIDITSVGLSGFDVGYRDGFDVWYRDEDHDWTSVWEFDTDTTFEVDPNARLEIRNHAGDVVVSTWDRSAVRVEASHSSRDKVKVFESGNVVRIKSETRHGPPDIVDYQLTIPKSVALDVWGIYTDVSVDGLGNGIRVETLEGDVSVRNSQGEMTLRSVEGSITIRNSRGRIEANTVEEDIVLINVGGIVYVESIDGDIRLEDLDSDDVEAKTVDGDIEFSGSIMDSGRYRLTTHDGDVVVAIPSGVNATVSVATFDGEFETSFPVKISKAEAGRRFSFTIGDGSARIELHAFDGDIQLVRR